MVTVGIVWDRLSPAPVDLVRASSGLCEPVLLMRSRHDLETIGSRLRRIVRAEPIEHAMTMGIQALTTFSESCVRVTASLAAELDVAGNPLEAAQRLTNKALQRQALNDAGVSVVPARPLMTKDDFEQMVGEGPSLPLILKPQEGTESRGVRLAADTADLERVLAEAGASGEPYLAESYLQGDSSVAGPEWGDYVSVECSSSAGLHRVQYVLGKGRMRRGFRETGNVYPSTLTQTLSSEIQVLVQQALSALGVLEGMSHTEVKLTREGPRIIEVNGRIGGGVAQLMRAALGVDVLREALEAMLHVEQQWGAPLRGRVPSAATRVRPGHATAEPHAWMTLYPDAEFVAANPWESIDARVRSVPGVVSVLPRNLYTSHAGAGASHSVEVLVAAPDHTTLSGRMAELVRITDGPHPHYLDEFPLGQ